MSVASRNIGQVLSMAKKTKIPPCGAWLIAWKLMISEPVMPAPTMEAGMTRSGSAAAKGIAPSEMKAAPSSQAALPFSRSAPVNSFGDTAVARAIASGGTMPAAITAAMIISGAGFSATEPAPAGYREGISDLVDRPAQIDGHHQAQDQAEDRRRGAGHARQPAVEGFGELGNRPAQEQEHQA